MNYFITGTDTDAGKTYVTALLTRSLRKAGSNIVAIKPIAAGSWEDSKALQAAADNTLSLEEITPIFYHAALGPMQAAAEEGKTASLEAPLKAIEGLQQKYTSLLIEGVGGWKVPLTYEKTTADIAAAIGYPIILVVRNRLGALNHALLTLESIKNHGLMCAGVILNNHPSDQNDPARKGVSAFFRELAQRERWPLFLEIEAFQQELILPSSCL